MDDSDVLLATLNNTLKRYSNMVQSYEIEIANMAAEIARLQKQLNEGETQNSQQS